MPSATMSRCPLVAQTATSCVGKTPIESWLFERRMPKSLTEACFRTNVGQITLSWVDMRVNEYHTCDSLLTAGASSLHDARKKIPRNQEIYIVSGLHCGGNYRRSL